MNRNLITILGVLALVLGAGLAVMWLGAREREQGSAVPEAKEGARQLAPPFAPEAPAPLEGERAAAATSASESAPAPIAETELALVGRVRAAEDLAPLAKARVVAREPGGATLIEAETDEQGGYRMDLAGAVPQALYLVASFPGRESRMLLPAWGQESTTELPDLLLTQGFTVAGQVLALGDRRPIEDAEVELASALPGFELGTLDAPTEEDGSFEFSGVTELPRDALRITVVADGFIAERRRLEPVDDAANALTVEVLLADSVAITGEVYDGTAMKPIAGARIEVDSSQADWVEESLEAVCDEEGRFRIELREFPVHSALVFARNAGFQPTCLPLSPFQAMDNVKVGGLLLFPPVVLRGVAVEEGSTGHPRAGVVHVRPSDVPEELAERFQDSTSLRNDGSFELALVNAPAGCPLEIVVDADGYLPGRKDLLLQPQSHADSVAGLRVEVARAMRLHATVVDEGKTPLAGARVQWWAPEAAGRVRLGGETVTNEQGLFYLDVPSSEARQIRVSVEFHGRRAVWRAPELAITDVNRGPRPVLVLPGAAAAAPDSDH